MDVLATPTHSFDAVTKTVIANVEGFLDFETFKKICLISVEKLKEHKTGNLLVDTSSLKVMPKENQIWIQGVWFPLAMQAGMSKLAFLVPDNPFGRASMEAANKEASNEGAVAMRYFFNKQEALDWLREG
ncbi:MAG: STAS/SEC14 domain-containing protein [Salibacteraceae bacterium]